MPQAPEIGLEPGPGLGAVRTMPEFRAFAAQRRTIVDQAELLVEGLYVRLPFKRAMHAADPLQRLRLLRCRLAELTGEGLRRRSLVASRRLEAP